MLKIEFEYRDDYSHGRWNRQSCCMESVKECIDFYGLGKDCEYRILSVEDLSKKENKKALSQGFSYYSLTTSVSFSLSSISILLSSF